MAANDLNASKGKIGIYGADYMEPKAGWEWIPGGPLYAFHSQRILLWCFIILISVAIFNLLPIPMLDGDGLLTNGLSLIVDDEKTIMKIMWPLRILSLGILLLSIALSFITGKGLF
jgi:membrane-associated protease RseP (regulator of RpoE activity)